MQVGSLELQLYADIARLRRDMEDAKSVVGGAMQSIQGSVELAKKALGALGLGLSIGAFASMIKGAIESAAALEKLSIQTGATVENLSAMKGIATLVGTNIEAVATAMNKMSKAMAVTNEDSKGAGTAVKSLGLNLDEFKRLKPDEQLIAVAKAMDQFADGGGKSAAAMALWGKQGATLLPFMKELAAAGELQAKATKEQTDEAEEFEKNLIRLKVSGEGWKKELAMGMLPALDDAARALVGVMNGSDGLRAGVKKLADDGSIAEWTRVAISGLSYVVDAVALVKRTFQTLGEFIVASVTSSVEFFSSVGQAFKQATSGDFVAAVHTMGTAITTQKSIWADFSRQVSDTWGESTLGKQFRDRVADIEKLGKAAKAAKPDVPFDDTKAKGGKDNLDAMAKAYGAVMQKITEFTAAQALELTQQEKVTEGQKLAIGILDMLRTGKLKLSEQDAIALGKAIELALATEKEADAHRDNAKAIAEMVKARAEYIASLEKDLDKGKDELAKLKEEGAAIGATKEAVAELAAAKHDAAAASLDLIAADAAASDGEYQMYAKLAQQQRDIAAQIRANAADQTQFDNFKSMWESIDRTAHDVFTNIFEGGSNVFKKLTETLKATLLDLLYQMTVRKWIFNIVGNVTGGGGVAGAAIGGASQGAMGSVMSNAGSMGTISSIGSAMAGGYSGAGAAGFAATGGSFASTAGAGLATDAMGATVAEGTAAATIETGAMGAASAGLAAIPVVGWIALAAIALYSIFGKKGGGPKNESGFGVGMPDRGDPAGATQIAQSIQAQYSALAGNLGVKDTKLSNLGAFYAQDPQGTAQTQLQITGGSYVRSDLYGGKYENVGRSDAEFQQAVALASEQLVLKNLQGAVDSKVGDFLRTINATSSSLETLQNALQVAQDVGTLDKALDGLGGSFLSLKNASVDATETFVKNMGGLQNATATLNSYFDNFYSDTEKRAAAAKNIANALNTAGLDITSDQVLGMTRDQFRGLVDAAAANPASDLYAALLSVNQAFANLIPATTDAGNALSDSAQKIAQSGKDLWTWARGMGVTRAGTASPQDQLDAAMRAYVQDRSLAAGGNADAYGRLQDSANAYIDAAKLNYSSGIGTQAIIDQVMAEVAALPAVKSYNDSLLSASIDGASQITDAVNAQTSALTAQLDALKDKVTELVEAQAAAVAVAVEHAQLTQDSGNAIVKAVNDSSSGGATARSGGVILVDSQGGA